MTRSALGAWLVMAAGAGCGGKAADLGAADAATPDAADDLATEASESDGIAADAAPGPGFYETVAPILANRCWTCHTVGGIAPFPLIDYEDVRDKAGAIEAAVRDRVMPPWLADSSGSCRTFKGSAWLRDDEIAAISDWIAGGKAMGDPAKVPAPVEPPPTFDAPDLSVDIGVDYRPTEGLLDETRCFLIDPKLDQDRSVTAFQVVPGLRRMVHHVILYALDDAAVEDDVAARDKAAFGPGFTCRSTTLEFPTRVVAAWVPGTPPTSLPDGTGIRLRAGRKLVMQVHYNTASGIGVDRTRIDLRFGDKVTSGEILFFGALNFVLPPGEAETVVRGSMRIKKPTWIGAVGPHMHLLGRNERIDLFRGGAEECLMDVPRYSFNWQRMFFDESPMLLMPGDRLNLRCTYDTTSAVEPISSGEDNNQEMCVAVVYLWGA